ncbi:hypothetical protein FRB94_003581 [Tulasnella sp. JGI-2019a]|nr:hypothetical protein FRB94_003581 [Tulasnella sp. JGI-2019a]
MQCLRSLQWPQVSRPVIIRSFHVSSPQCESQRKRVARLKKAKNIAKRAVIDAEIVKARPHPVLGLSEANAEKWKETKLYKILVKPEDLEATANSATSSGTSHAIVGLAEGQSSATSAPADLAFGLSKDTVHHLLHTLPALNKSLQLSTDRAASEPLDSILDRRKGPAAQRAYTPYNYNAPTTTTSPLNPSSPSSNPTPSETRSNKASEALMKIIDLRNASAGGIAYENRRRIVEAFSSPAEGRKGPDTGRPEVQAALLTAQIRNLWNHLLGKQHRHDIHSRRSLQLLVHQRARILKYLRRVDPIRYEMVLPEIGVEKGAVEGEIIVR